MSYRKILSLSISLLFLFAMIGCQSIPQEHRGAATGAGIGAAAGATAGALFGKNVGSTVIGGLLGGLVGGVIGNYAVDQRKNRAETLQTYNYQPSQGDVVTIENTSTSPQVVSPGEVVHLQMTYAVMTPNSASQISLREIREITHNGNLVGSPEVQVTRSSGTFQSSIPLRLPDSAERGVYVVTSKIQTPTATDTRVTRFEVR